MSRLAVAGLALAAGLLASAPPAAAGGDEAFFRSVVGPWSGPGEIVAGKYKGTKFVCTFEGGVPDGAVGMRLDGSCRVGLFWQAMTAEVVRKGSRYSGSFLDGAKGKGLDIVSGRFNGDRMIFGLDRKQLEGAMVARLDGPDTMNITISVRVAQDLVPVIGMSLSRAEPAPEPTAFAP